MDIISTHDLSKISSTDNGFQPCEQGFFSNMSSHHLSNHFSDMSEVTRVPLVALTASSLWQPHLNVMTVEDMTTEVNVFMGYISFTQDLMTAPLNEEVSETVQNFSQSLMTVN